MYSPKFIQEPEPTSIPKEPLRDWSLGFITGHRTRVIVYLIAINLISVAWYFLSREGRFPTTVFDNVWSWAGVLWLSALVPGTLGLFGILMYRHPTALDHAQPIDRTICWRIVTAGKNIDIVLSTIRRCQSEMARTPLAQYIIEVVIDECDNVCLLPADAKDVRVIIVPKDYRTPNNSRFKARALHYALLNSPISDTTWIVHLDEETQPTSSAIKGICQFIQRQELLHELHLDREAFGSKRSPGRKVISAAKQEFHSGEKSAAFSYPALGQGALLYHRQWEKHPFLTLADNVRTGDDFARFYFQHRLGVTIFGLHGSFIVIRNDVEKATGGFDFGPHGDITEDAFWAVKAMENGFRCAWVEGYLEEQSCMSFLDFLRQRRRWFQGLIKVSLHAPVKLRWRFCLGLNTMLWGLAPFATIYTFANLFYHVFINPIIIFLASYSLATFATLYMIGLRANMDEHGIKSWRRRLTLALLQFFLLPLFSTMESLGVLWAILTPVKGFQVVKK